MAERSSYAVIVLAAGASSRMGRPKQLLPWKGQPLLRHVVQAAVNAAIGSVRVVLGANAHAVERAIEGLPVVVVINDEWQEGMSSSIRAGVAAMESAGSSALRGVIILLGDQPAVPSSHLRLLAKTHASSGKSMIVSRTSGQLCPPVLFAPIHFSALKSLRGDAGAKALFQAHAHDLAVVDAADFGDLDTPRDYEDLLREEE